MSGVVSKKRRAELNRREYVRRKSEIFTSLGGKCQICSSVDDLQIDHIIPSEKSFDILERWSRDKKLTDFELKKCQLLCETCHHLKSVEDGTWRGSNNGRSKLSESDIFQIRDLANKGHSHRQIAEAFNISKSTITNILNGRRWGWLKND